MANPAGMSDNANSAGVRVCDVRIPGVAVADPGGATPGEAVAVPEPITVAPVEGGDDEPRWIVQLVVSRTTISGPDHRRARAQITTRA